MPQLRISIQTGGFTMGSSETWISPNLEYTPLAAQLSQLLNLRAQLLFGDCYFQGVRVSQWVPPQDLTAARRRSIMLPPGKIQYPPGGVAVVVPSVGQYLSGPPTPSTEEPYRAALQLQCTFDTSRTTQKYLQGVPSASSAGINGAYVPSGSPTWDANLANYLNFLVQNGWSIQALDRTAANPPQYIMFVRPQPTGTAPLLGLIFQGNAPSWSPGTRVQLQGFLAAKGTRGPTVNGTWYIDSSSSADYPGNTIFYLRGSQAVTPAMVRFTDRTRVYRYLFTTYPVAYITALRVVWHKRGKPVTGPRGRRLSHYTLDP